MTLRNMAVKWNHVPMYSETELQKAVKTARAAERERIRQLAFQHGALCNREPGTIFRSRVPPDLLADGIMTFTGLLDQLEAKTDEPAR